MTDHQETAQEARVLLRSTDAGILCAHSVELEGYPFGSVTPYSTTIKGEVVVYLSTIAQHTKNIQANPKVCLTVMDYQSPDKQAAGRVTVVGDAMQVPEDEADEVQERYFNFFLDSRGYAGAHDFAFYKIQPVRVRYIGGFGKIYWIEPEQWLRAIPEWKSDEAYIIDHMNSDHQSSLNAICAHYVGKETEAARLIAVDVEGFHIRTGKQIHYLPFSAACETLSAVRSEMVQMARTSAR